MSQYVKRIIAFVVLFLLVTPIVISYGKSFNLAEKPNFLKNQQVNEENPKPFPDNEINRNMLEEKNKFIADLPGFSSVNGESVNIPQGYSALQKRFTNLFFDQKFSGAVSSITTQQTTSASGIYGYVTQNGVSASGIYLLLRYYNGSSWSTMSTTNTDFNGYYSFTSVPSLSSGEYYYVRFLNNPYVSGRIYYWSTTSINEYTIGDNVHIGDFDIADIGNRSPNYGKTISLPNSFSWNKRSATPTEEYELNLFNPSGDEYWFATIGNNSRHTLNCLPEGFKTGKIYGWYIGVYSPDGGYGYTTYDEVTFNRDSRCSGIHGTVTKNGIAASGIYLELRFVEDNATNFSTRSDAATGVNGEYKFVNIPTLNNNDSYYYVRFLGSDNDGSTNNLLWFWGTRHLDSYTQNSDSVMANFDIADVALGLPENGSTIKLPYTITWSLRPATPSDNYHLDIEESTIYEPYWLIPRGYKNSFTINCLLMGMETNKDYDWLIFINYPGTGEYGTSYYYKQFKISEGIACQNSFLPMTVR